MALAQPGKSLGSVPSTGMKHQQLVDPQPEHGVPERKLLHAHAKMTTHEDRGFHRAKTKLTCSAQQNRDSGMFGVECAEIPGILGWLRRLLSSFSSLMVVKASLKLFLNFFCFL